MRTALRCAVIAALALGACSSDDNEPTNTTAGASMRAQQVGNFDQPVALAVLDKTIYIAEQAGVVRRLNGSVALDIRDRVQSGGEEGLLGLAFAPDGTKLYAYWTNEDGDNGVYEYPFAERVADKSQQRTIVSLRHPNFGNHNGGNIVFGPDDALYVGTGDGGGGGDPAKNGQNTASLLGKMLRVDVSGPAPKVEVWHYGLRNPWRFSFDRATDELWIADVGQGEWEEINKVDGTRRGVNFGWSLREGTHAFNGGTAPAGAVDPVYEYNHDGGNCTVVGGYVYRGERIPSLKGAYLFADYCVGDLKKLVGSQATDLGITIENPSSFGQDDDGELFVLSLSGGVFKLVPAGA